MWVDRKGQATPIDPSWEVIPGANIGASISADGTRLALNILGGGSTDVWIKQLDRGPLSRLTFDGERNFRPMWAPDGRSVIYMSNRDDASYNLYQRRADGSDSARKILDLKDRINEAVWTPDAKWLVLRMGGATGSTGDRYLTAIQPGVDSAPRQLVASRFDAKVISLSSDGKWLAYESTESGREEIVVRPFPEVGSARVQVSSAGGLSPVFSRKRPELFFVNGAGQLVSVPYTVQNGEFRAGEPVELFPIRAKYFMSGNSRTYDTHPDGERFLFFGRRDADRAANATDLILLEHWYSELLPRLSSSK
jgi:Tol biopolymer transport system component